MLARYGWLAWLVVLLLLVRFGLFLPQAAVRPSHGFIAYYVSSQLLAEGADASQFYDTAWFKEQIDRFHPTAEDVHINPPTTNLLLLPLVGFDYRPARIIWTIVNVIGLVGMVSWLRPQLAFSGAWTPALFALVLWFQPVYANFHLGQAYILVFGLLLVAWHSYRHGHDFLLGLSLSLLFLLKLAGILVWPLLLVQRRWRALGWAVGVTAVLFLVTLPWLGVSAWRQYGQVLLALNGSPERSVTAYQTVRSFFGHLFTFDMEWNPSPIIELPLLGTWLPWLTFVALLIISLVIARKNTLQPEDNAALPNDLLFAAFVILGVILSPLSLDYHFPILILPIGILAQWGRSQTAVWPWVLLAICIFLIGADLPYRAPRLAVGFWALLAYPKLYGALLLWSLTLYGARAPIRSGHQTTDQP